MNSSGRAKVQAEHAVKQKPRPLGRDDFARFGRSAQRKLGTPNSTTRRFKKDLTHNAARCTKSGQCNPPVPFVCNARRAYACFLGALVAGPRNRKVRFWGYVANMPNVRTKIPIVEVIAPDGSKSLWVAAVAKANAVAAVKEIIPPNYVAALIKQRLTITRKSEVLRRGEVRRLRL